MMLSYIYSILPAWPTFWSATSINSTSDNPTVNGEERLPIFEDASEINLVASTALKSLNAEPAAYETEGSLIRSTIGTGTNSFQVVIDAASYAEQNKNLLFSIAEAKENLAQRDFSETLHSSLALSFLEEFEKVIEAPIGSAQSNYEDLWAEDEFPIPENSFNVVKHIFQEISEIPLSQVENTPSKPVFTPPSLPAGPPPLLRTDYTFKPIAPKLDAPLPSEALSKLKIATSQEASKRKVRTLDDDAKSTFVEKIQEQAKKIMLKQASIDPLEKALRQELLNLKKAIYGLISNNQENIQFMIKFPLLIESFLNKTIPASTDDLSESRQFNDATAEKIVFFNNQFLSNDSAQIRLRALLRESLQDLKTIALEQKKKNEEAVKEFLQKSRLARGAPIHLLLENEGDFALTKKSWLSHLPHAQFEENLSAMKQIQLLSALKIPEASAFSTRYPISSTEDLAQPLDDFLTFHRKVQSAEDQDQLNALKHDYHFWSSHFISYLPMGFRKTVDVE